jgi:hypothetical protein
MKTKKTAPKKAVVPTATIETLLGGLTSLNAIAASLVQSNPKLRTAAIQRIQTEQNAALARAAIAPGVARMSEMLDKKALAASIKQKRADLAKHRDRLRKAKADPKARVFTLRIKDGKGKSIRALRELTWAEAHKQQRDWYKVMRLTMKLDVKLSIEFEEQAAA